MVAPSWIRPSEEIQEALTTNQPVVILESSVFCQGLPMGVNFEAAERMYQAIRQQGAIPACAFIDHGSIFLHSSLEELERLCTFTQVAKSGAADIPFHLSKNNTAATTVSATLTIADLVNIPVFATGGIGGAHHAWAKRWDVSSDLSSLKETDCVTVCSGVKSILDIPNTLEFMETLAIQVALYQTDFFPEFFSVGEHRYGFRHENLEELVRTIIAQKEVYQKGTLICQNVPQDHCLPLELLHHWIGEAQLSLKENHIQGKAVTPYLLGRLAELSGGETIQANLALLENNALLAAQLANKLSS